MVGNAGLAESAYAGVPQAARFRLSLVLTHACPLRCSYCYAGRSQNRHMPSAVADRALDRVFQTLTAGAQLDLVLFGGEPLLAFDEARRVVDRAREMAARHGVTLRIPITTSGAVPLSGEVLRFLAAPDMEVALSIDGLSEVHDRFRPMASGKPSSPRALAALAALVEVGVAFRVVSVVRPETVALLADGLRSLIARGARSFDPALDWGACWDVPALARLESALVQVADLYAEHRGEVEVSWFDTLLAWSAGGVAADALACGFGRGEVAVAPSGRLYPCERLVGEDRAPHDHSLGHLDDASGPFQPAACSGSVEIGADCAGCPVETLCARGCACANLSRSGRPDQPDGLMCTFESARLRAGRRLARCQTTAVSSMTV